MDPAVVADRAVSWPWEMMGTHNRTAHLNRAMEDRAYRREKALTVALMGLLAEDARKPPRRLPHVAHQKQRQGRAEPEERMLARPAGLTGLTAGAS